MNLIALVGGYALQIITAAIAIVLARRRAYHAPFAVYAWIVALVDPSRALLQLFRSGGPHPLAGFARALYHADACGFMLVALGLGVLACSVCAPRARDHALGAALAVMALSVALYGAASGRAFITAAQVLAVTVAWIALGVRAARREWPSVTIVLIAIYASAETSALIGAFIAEGRLSSAWPSARGGYIAAAMAAAAIQIAWIAYARREDQGREGRGA